jgi:hypothetical protein
VIQDVVAEPCALLLQDSSVFKVGARGHPWHGLGLWHRSCDWLCTTWGGADTRHDQLVLSTNVIGPGTHYVLGRVGFDWWL